jgi:hypothetical protein
VHAEVPEVRVAQHLLPRVDAGDRGVHDRGAPQVPVLAHVGVRHHPAYVVADQGEVAQLELDGELVDRLGELAL